MFDNQETFWRIPAKISPSQLRSAAAALSLREDQPRVGEEQERPTSQTEKHLEEEEEEKEEKQEEEEDAEVSGEQRAQALRALLLSRKRKPRTTKHTGMSGSCTIVALWCQMAPVNYSFLI